MSWQVGLYVAAVFLPLVAFTVQILGIRLLGRLNAYIATGAIGLAFVLSLVGFCEYFFVEAHGVFSHHAVHQASPRTSPTARGRRRRATPRPAEHAEAHGARGHDGPVVWKCERRLGLARRRDDLARQAPARR